MAKVVIIGAGSAMFAKKLIGDLLLDDEIRIDTIALVDINTEKLKVMDQVAQKMCSQVGKSIRIESADRRRDVLAGAAYVINTINVGGALRYKEDLEIADKYGVYQAIGDIIGPGGMFRCLRAYPEILRICKDMEELCPDAYLFNYTNPMAPLCLALNKQTSIKIFGFCHNVQSTALQLSAYLQVPREHVSFWAAGINHMDWFLQYKVNGKDAYPDLFKISQTEEKIIALSKFEPDYSKMGVEVIDSVRFNVMKHFGYFVSESPFHMSEYLPYYRKNKKAVEDLHVQRRWWLDFEMSADVYFEELKKLIAGKQDIPIEKTFEYAPKIIHANLTGQPFRANLNVMNTGLIENLPQDSVVEVPCYADSEGIHPCYVGKLPDALAALNISNINVHQLMAKAANEKKLRYIYEGIKLDPLTGAVLNLDHIKEMTDELIRANSKYLVDFR